MERELSFYYFNPTLFYILLASDRRKVGHAVQGFVIGAEIARKRRNIAYAQRAVEPYFAGDALVVGRKFYGRFSPVREQRIVVPGFEIADNLILSVCR